MILSHFRFKKLQNFKLDYNLISTLDLRVLICYTGDMQAEFSEIMSRLSENARFALQKSDFYAKRYNNGYMGTEHLLMGVLAMDTSTAATMLREAGVTVDDVEKSLNKVAVEVAAPSDMAMMSLSEAVI